jgi:FtsP/CotA-like multicopper oxidase with cupredoxin domain
MVNLLLITHKYYLSEHLFSSFHEHGQKFIIISKNGEKIEDYAWKDTVMLGNRETVDIAFVAEEKGEWLFHCHILEHAEAGMLSVLKVI